MVYHEKETANTHLYRNLLPLKNILLLDMVLIWLDFAYLEEKEQRLLHFQHRRNMISKNEQGKLQALLFLYHKVILNNWPFQLFLRPLYKLQYKAHIKQFRQHRKTEYKTSDYMDRKARKLNADTCCISRDSHSQDEGKTVVHQKPLGQVCPNTTLFVGRYGYFTSPLVNHRNNKEVVTLASKNSCFSNVSIQSTP